MAKNEVQVFAVTLSVPSDDLPRLIATLSPLEKERAGRFKFDLHRNRFIVGRGLLRTILGGYLNTSPSQLGFIYSPEGKPELIPEEGGPDLYFNLAHSDDLALIGMTHIGPIGVDVEMIRPIEGMDELVATFFSQRENKLFQMVPLADKPTAFFNLWTRKEALLKATGEGITRSLNRVEVSFLPDEPARLLAISGDAKRAASWSLQTLSPAPEFVGAVAIETQNPEISCWKWDGFGPEDGGAKNC